jgi:hypothetical protein
MNGTRQLDERSLFPRRECVVVLTGVKAKPFGWLRQP